MADGGIKKKIDDFQQGHPPLAFVYGIVKKYGDENGGNLAALITYYGFLSLFPLLLAFFSIAAFVLKGRAGTLHTLETHLGAYPIIGPAVMSLSNHQSGGSILAVIIGLLALIWGAQGLSNTLIFVNDEIWHIPYTDRSGKVTKLLRGYGWYAVFGIGALVSTFLSSLSRVFHLGAVGPYFSVLLALILDVTIFVVSFRLLTHRDVPTKSLWRGAAIAGLIWTVINRAGLGLVSQLSGSNPLYGSFASVLGLLAFIYLNARLTLYCAEGNVVGAEHLWPRSLDKETPTDADTRQQENLAKREVRTESAKVTVDA